jgi:hypothetical protein
LLYTDANVAAAAELAASAKCYNDRKREGRKGVCFPKMGKLGVWGWNERNREGIDLLGAQDRW